ncbi:hypothetical protein PYW08_002479 [Mythimna loreyi]|uniref:Uncharacterized protein n=1 Tax=Mythimna loreyi TaxID=667449 RepID=A0ACC2QIH2_9NEOP|nr:hypothetical protein PYW08_002479 [Mythimna loreyi]
MDRTNLDKSLSETDLDRVGLQNPDHTTPPNFVVSRQKRKRENDFVEELAKFKEEMQSMFSNMMAAQEKEFKKNSIILQGIQQSSCNIDSSIIFLTEQNEEFKKKIVSLEDKIKEDKKYIILLEDKIETMQQDNRKANFELKNVPKKSNETKDDLIHMVFNILITITVLQGIGPVDDEVVEQHDDDSQPGLDGEEEEPTSMRRLWAGSVHAGTINYIATHADLVATASSDGVARLFRWVAAARELQPLHELAAHHYPVMACDFAAAGRVLLTAGLDGRACIWDVGSGVQLRSLCCAEGVGGEAGGGGVRAARASGGRPALLLLATDDGLAPLWSLDDDDPKPLHVFVDHSGAVTCCAWSSDARLAATGSAAGELCLRAPPPSARVLHHEPHAHDLGEWITSLEHRQTCRRAVLARAAAQRARAAPRPARARPG